MILSLLEVKQWMAVQQCLAFVEDYGKLWFAKLLHLRYNPVAHYIYQKESEEVALKMSREASKVNFYLEKIYSYLAVMLLPF